MLPLKPICERKNVRRDGTNIVFIQYCYSSENRINLNTKISIPPAFWNKTTLSITKDLPTIYGDYKHLNSEIKRMVRLVEDIVEFAELNLIVDRVKFVKEVFTPKFDLDSLKNDEEKIKCITETRIEKVNLDLYFQIDQYILTKEKKVSRATLSVFNQMKMHLKAFEIYRNKPITFESFDYSFYEAFTEFLTLVYVHKRIKESRKGLPLERQ